MARWSIHFQFFWTQCINIVLLCTELKKFYQTNKASWNMQIKHKATNTLYPQHVKTQSSSWILLHVQLHGTLFSYSLCKQINFSWTYSPYTNNKFDSWPQGAAKELPHKSHTSLSQWRAKELPLKLDGSWAQCTAKEPPCKSDSTFSR